VSSPDDPIPSPGAGISSGRVSRALDLCLAQYDLCRWFAVSMFN